MENKCKKHLMPDLWIDETSCYDLTLEDDFEDLIYYSENYDEDDYNLKNNLKNKLNVIDNRSVKEIFN